MTGSPKAKKPAKPLKALLVQIEESLNLRDPRLRGSPRFLKKKQGTKEQ